MSAILPERDPSKPAEQQGLFRKFDVRRVDGSDQPGGKHHGCRYFVLDVDHDPHAIAALAAYANTVEATHPDLARDLREKWGAKPKWQPIETAPTDGTNILAIVAGTHPMSGKPFIPEVVEWTDAGWWNCMWPAGDDTAAYEPTHWMPLPPAPSLENLEEQP